VGAAHLQRHFFELAGVLVERFGHKVERGTGNGIAGAPRQIAQLIRALPPSLCSVERVCHAPETGTHSIMFLLRALREGAPDIRDLLLSPRIAGVRTTTLSVPQSAATPPPMRSCGRLTRA
jgi:hypothetical protein